MHLDSLPNFAHRLSAAFAPPVRCVWQGLRFEFDFQRNIAAI
jgi:hypothetical protein